jgi:hypothetical protein
MLYSIFFFYSTIEFRFLKIQLCFYAFDSIKPLDKQQTLKSSRSSHLAESRIKSLVVPMTTCFSSATFLAALAKPNKLAACLATSFSACNALAAKFFELIISTLLRFYILLKTESFSASVFLLFFTLFTTTFLDRKTKNPFRYVSKRVLSCTINLYFLESADTHTHHGINTHHHRLRFCLANVNLNCVELLHTYIVLILENNDLKMA